jgi:hypothetical protein
MTKRNIQPYITLIRSFVGNKVGSSEFVDSYLRSFKDDPGGLPEAEYKILNEVFGACDALCEDENLRTSYDIGEDQLREECKLALEALEKLTP